MINLKSMIQSWIGLLRTSRNSAALSTNPAGAPMADSAHLKSILPSRLAQWADSFMAAGLVYGVSPTLLAAICDRESRGGEALLPHGPTGTGDNGHGRGLMQLDDRTHQRFLDAAFFDGVPLWRSPAFNILYGCWLLRHYYNLSVGRWAVAIAAYNAGLTRALRATPGDLRATPGDPRATPGDLRATPGDLRATPGDPTSLVQRLDALTTGGDYVSDVLKRQAAFDRS